MYKSGCGGCVLADAMGLAGIACCGPSAAAARRIGAWLHGAAT
jgi:hypothetical protein